jgi:hypothetical protein
MTGNVQLYLPEAGFACPGLGRPYGDSPARSTKTGTAGTAAALPGGSPPSGPFLRFSIDSIVQLSTSSSPRKRGPRTRCRCRALGSRFRGNDDQEASPSGSYVRREPAPSPRPLVPSERRAAMTDRKQDRSTPHEERQQNQEGQNQSAGQPGEGGQPPSAATAKASTAGIGRGLCLASSPGLPRYGS